MNADRWPICLLRFVMALIICLSQRTMRVQQQIASDLKSIEFDVSILDPFMILFIKRLCPSSQVREEMIGNVR